VPHPQHEAASQLRCQLIERAMLQLASQPGNAGQPCGDAWAVNEPAPINFVVASLVEKKIFDPTATSLHIDQHCHLRRYKDVYKPTRGTAIHEDRFTKAIQ